MGIDVVSHSVAAAAATSERCVYILVLAYTSPDLATRPVALRDMTDEVRNGNDTTMKSRRSSGLPFRFKCIEREAGWSIG